VNTPVNLNRVRKDKARAEKQARATQNSVKYGRSKADKKLEEAKAAQIERGLDAHRKEP